MLRDSEGVWIEGYAYNLGKSNAYQVELWGVYHGLSQAWERGFRKIVLQVDNKMVVQAITSSSTSLC